MRRPEGDKDGKQDMIKEVAVGTAFVQTRSATQIHQREPQICRKTWKYSTWHILWLAHPLSIAVLPGLESEVL